MTPEEWIEKALRPIVDMLIRQAVQEEREACAYAVFAVRMDATEPDAPDEEVAGWLEEAERAIRERK